MAAPAPPAEIIACPNCGRLELGDDLVLLGVEGQAGDAGLLDQVGGGADQADEGGQRAVPARGGGGHDGAPFVVTGVTASTGIVRGMGMTFANDAGPRRDAAAPPSPAAGGWSRSAPAARRLRLAGRWPHHSSGQGLWSRAGPAARAAGNHSRGTDRMKDVAARVDEEHMSRGRVTVGSLYPAG
jgi:hypothetical protein